MAQVDVVMSVYNMARFLPAALASIRNQTVADIRIIIVDDGSTDATATIIAEAQEADGRIVHLHQTNGGIVSAVTRGVRLCTAPFIARHDGDDISRPDRFERQLAYLRAHPDCVAVSGLSRHIDEHGAPTGTTSSVKDMTLVDEFALPAREPYISQPFLMMRRDVCEATGGYRLLTVAEDTDLYWRMSRVGRLHVMPEILGDYRMHAGSISSRSVVAGRRMAAWTQMSALSAQRARCKRADISFTPELQRSIDSSHQLAELYEVVLPLLRPDEAAWFYAAMAAKLVELCYYRPFELEAADIAYIRSVPRKDRDVARRRFHDIYAEGVLSAGVRLGLQGRCRDALRLVPWRRWLHLAGRMLFRGILPRALRTRIKTILRR